MFQSKVCQTKAAGQLCRSCVPVTGTVVLGVLTGEPATVLLCHFVVCGEAVRGTAITHLRLSLSLQYGKTDGAVLSSMIKQSTL